MNNFTIGLIASLLAGMATFVGALPILLPIKLTPSLQAIMLGFGGGVMLAATAFSLVVPGIEAATGQGFSTVGAALAIAAGLLLGAWFLELTHRYFPHEHFIKGPESIRSDPSDLISADNLKRAWLFVAAIALHNFPEGLAVGVSFGTGEATNGVAIAIGIALQNLPEGLVVALSLVTQGYSKGFALWISLLTGLIEPVGGLLGLGLVTLAQSLLPWGLAFAAGAMLFVISDEIIPESHRQGRERQGTLGVMMGFVVMMVLDVTLG